MNINEYIRGRLLCISCWREAERLLVIKSLALLHALRNRVHIDYTENVQKSLPLLSCCFHGPLLVTRMNNKVMQNTVTMNCKLVVKYAETLMVTSYLFIVCLFMKLI